MNHIPSLPPQPYSRHLRAIAALLADRTDHRAALREIADLLETWGIPVAPAETSCYHEENT